MKKVLATLATVASLGFADTLVSGQSALSVDETAMKLQNILKEKGLKIFGVYEHSKLAKEVDMDLRDTVVVAFGAPKAGTPLMQCSPTVALELPLKMLIYTGEDGKTTVAYDDIKNIAKRHNAECGDVVENLSKAQANFFKAITE